MTWPESKLLMIMTQSHTCFNRCQNDSNQIDSTQNLTITNINPNWLYPFMMMTEPKSTQTQFDLTKSARTQFDPTHVPSEPNLILPKITWNPTQPDLARPMTSLLDPRLLKRLKPKDLKGPDTKIARLIPGYMLILLWLDLTCTWRGYVGSDVPSRQPWPTDRAEVLLKQSI